MARIGNLIRDPVELKKRSVELDTLASMLERVTKDDLRRAAQALLDCSDDIAYLLSSKNKPIGCPCTPVENDNYSYFIYVDACPHHHQYKARLETMEKEFKVAEKKLEDKLRVSFLEAAVQGLLAGGNEATPKVLLDRAMEIADAAIARLRE